MRLAVYNVENLFDRAKAMNHGTWDTGRQVLEDFSSLNKLLGQERYSDAEKTQMVALIVKLGMEKSDTGPFVILRRNRGGLLKRPKAGGVEIVADGRFDWTGSLELRDEPVNERAMQNTARVIRDLEADVLGVVEAESRPVLSAFNHEILPVVDAAPFQHVMLIDGNDERGIDVGLMTGRDFPIGLMRSHVDDRNTPDGQPIFSRDCPEFQVRTKEGETLVVLVNHFKSKGYGDLSAASRRRRAQAQRAREICEGLIADGFKYVALIGDLNDTPESHALEPLASSAMKDAFNHPLFDKGGFEGTYGNCGPQNKIDYLFLSPKLYEKVKLGGVWRKGVWAGVRAKRWENYPEMTKEEEAASDHAALWVNLDI